MPSAETAPLFAEAAKLGIGFMLGYAELTQEAGQTRRFNTSILVDKAGKIALKYRKVCSCRGTPTTIMAAVPASGEGLFRGRATWVPGGARLRRHHGHVHLQ